MSTTTTTTITGPAGCCCGPGPCPCPTVPFDRGSPDNYFAFAMSATVCLTSTLAYPLHDVPVTRVGLCGWEVTHGRGLPGATNGDKGFGVRLECLGGRQYCFSAVCDAFVCYSGPPTTVVCNDPRPGYPLWVEMTYTCTDPDCDECAGGLPVTLVFFVKQTGYVVGTNPEDLVPCPPVGPLAAVPEAGPAVDPAAGRESFGGRTPACEYLSADPVGNERVARLGLNVVKTWHECALGYGTHSLICRCDGETCAKCGDYSADA